MSKNPDYFIDKLFEKLKNYKYKKIYLDKNEFNKFINFLVKNN